MRRALLGIAGAACLTALLFSCKSASPRPFDVQEYFQDSSTSLLPPEKWKATGPTLLRDDGRIYLTAAGSGGISRACSLNVDEYPYLMVCMVDSLPGALWQVYVEKDGQKTVLLETKEENEWLLPLKEKTGWTGPTSFTLGIGMSGRKGDWIVFGHLRAAKFDAEVPEVPVAVAPADRAVLRPYGVQFLWRQVKNAVAYEVQYGPAAEFATAGIRRVSSPWVADYLWQLPEEELPSGDCFWRVRAVNMEGATGPWSAVSQFTVTEGRPKPPERKVSADRPLIMMHCGPADMAANWEVLPEVVKQSAYLRIEALPVGEIEAACQAAEARKIPILIQVSGPHDFYGTTSSRVSLSELERFYQRYPMVKGAFICEQACQYDGIRNPNVWRYLDRLIRLSAHYGKLTVWADAHWGRYQWLGAAENGKLLETIRQNRESFIPVWKMNCGVTPYSVQSSLMGLWLSGVVDNWGVEPENWYWFEAGFAGENQQRWFKEGLTEKMPPSFYGQLLMLGMMTGASACVLEPTGSVWERPGVLTPGWTEDVYPVVRKMLTEKVLPDRERVWSLVTDAIAFDRAPEWRSDYDDVLKTWYKEIYRPLSIFDCLPKTGTYPAPIFLKVELDAAASASLDKSFQATKKGDVRIYRRKGAPERPTEDCLIVKLANATLAMNTNENAKSVQKFACELTGGFEHFEGELRTNEYFIAQQKAPKSLDLIYRMRAGESTLRLAFKAGTERAPKIEFAGQGGLDDCKVKWDPALSVLELRCISSKGCTAAMEITVP